MKNITVSVDDDLYRRARVRAAEEGTSVSRIVKDVLTKFAAGETERERHARERNAFYMEIDANFAGMTGDALRPGWRDEMYDNARGDSSDVDNKAA
jgi:plasmid stability protein